MSEGEDAESRLPLVRRWLQKVVGIAKSITLEPSIFVAAVGATTVTGNGFAANIIMDKICLDVFNYTDAVCANLTAHEAELDSVIAFQNNFSLGIAWLGGVPAFLLSVLAGPASKRIGNRILLIMPTLGGILNTFIEATFITFIRQLPITFCYLFVLPNLLGGLPVYFIGYYGYGTSITTPKERSVRMSRFDGCMHTGFLLGTALSEPLLQRFGFLANYLVNISCGGFALLWLIFYVRDPPRDVSSSPPPPRIRWRRPSFFRRSTLKAGIAQLLLMSREMTATLLQPRAGSLRMLFILQLLSYGLYLFVGPHENLGFFFMKKVFTTEFSTARYADYRMMQSIGCILGLLLFMPFVVNKLKLRNEGLLLAVLTLAATVGQIISAFSHSLWQFYLAQGLMSFFVCVYPLSRSLLTKTVHKSEVGNAFAIVGIASTLCPAIGDIVFRLVYNASLSTFPGAYWLLCAALSGVSTSIGLILFADRSQFQMNVAAQAKGDADGDEASPDEEEESHVVAVGEEDFEPSHPVAIDVNAAAADDLDLEARTPLTR